MNANELVKEVATNNKLKEVKKAESKRNWGDIAIASVATGLVNGLDLVGRNMYVKKVLNEEGPYSLKDMAIVTAVGAVAGGVVRAGLDYTPMAKDHDGRVFLTASTIFGTSAVSALAANKLLGIPALADVLALAEEE